MTPMRQLRLSAVFLALGMALPLLGALAPRAVIYVSCNPATLARDLARMPRYEIASLRAYDMFPQTAHVETVCELVERLSQRVELSPQRRGGDS